MYYLKDCSLVVELNSGSSRCAATALTTMPPLHINNQQIKSVSKVNGMWYEICKP